MPKRKLRPAAFSDADSNLADTLDNLDGADNYADWIFSLVEPHLGGTVLEVGAGQGTFTERLVRASTRVVAGDLSERRVESLKERFGDVDTVSVYQGNIRDGMPEGPFDSAVLINVLEHIKDDDETLTDLLEALRPGGSLILWVPAFELLYSDYDRRIGHFRRYRRSRLRSQLRAHGFEVVDCRYVNSVGAVAWAILARVLGRTPTAAGPVAIYDRYFIPVLRKLESRVAMPFGQSVFAVAIKPA